MRSVETPADRMKGQPRMHKHVIIYRAVKNEFFFLSVLCVPQALCV
jgi:hypothetical protein